MSGAQGVPSTQQDATQTRRRLLWLVVSGVLLMVVAAASALALIMSLVWTKHLDFESDGDAVMRHLRAMRAGQGTATTQGEAPQGATPHSTTPSGAQATQQGRTP